MSKDRPPFYCLLFIVIALLFFECSAEKPPVVVDEEWYSGFEPESDYPSDLISWNLFEDPIKELNPKGNVFPYVLNAPLFSDYSFKARFIRLPQDSAMRYRNDEVFDFPVGTVLIKNFYYPEKFADSEENKRIIETRLLIKESEDWVALPYVWNDEQTAAALRLAGASVQVAWTDTRGEVNSISYSVPNQIQCKSCHENSGELVPIGTSARQLNRTTLANGEKVEQLLHWQKQGIVDGLPENIDSIPFMPPYHEAVRGSYSLNDRARAWLDVNCGHCHRSTGPARSSGLYLTFNEDDPFRLGINKPPVAAGRGSGGRRFSIAPGDAEKSIIIYRITTLNPGEMMPELGRKLVHTEGVELISQWISEMPLQGYNRGVSYSSRRPDR